MALERRVARLEQATSGRLPAIIGAVDVDVVGVSAAEAQAAGWQVLDAGGPLLTVRLSAAQYRELQAAGGVVIRDEVPA